MSRLDSILSSMHALPPARRGSADVQQSDVGRTAQSDSRRSSGLRLSQRCPDCRPEWDCWLEKDNSGFSVGSQCGVVRGQAASDDTEYRCFAEEAAVSSGMEYRLYDDDDDVDSDRNDPQSDMSEECLRRRWPALLERRDRERLLEEQAHRDRAAARRAQQHQSERSLRRAAAAATAPHMTACDSLLHFTEAEEVRINRAAALAPGGRSSFWEYSPHGEHLRNEERIAILDERESALSHADMVSVCVVRDGRMRLELVPVVERAAEAERKRAQLRDLHRFVLELDAEIQRGDAAPGASTTLKTGQVVLLLDEARDALFESEHLGLRAKRALACTCSELRPVIFELLRRETLTVQVTDATFDNAHFVASVLVPNVPAQVLCVAGETCLPQMQLAHLRTLPRLKVGTMGWPAAVFFGAAIAESDSILRLSNGVMCKKLKPLRENQKIQLGDHSHADLFAMLGALRLNRHQGHWTRVAHNTLDNLQMTGERLRMREEITTLARELRVPTDAFGRPTPAWMESQRSGYN